MSPTTGSAPNRRGSCLREAADLHPPPQRAGVATSPGSGPGSSRPEACQPCQHAEHDHTSNRLLMVEAAAGPLGRGCARIGGMILVLRCGADGEGHRANAPVAMSRISGTRQDIRTRARVAAHGLCCLLPCDLLDWPACEGRSVILVVEKRADNPLGSFTRSQLAIRSERPSLPKGALHENVFTPRRIQDGVQRRCLYGSYSQPCYAVPNCRSEPRRSISRRTKPWPCGDNSACGFRPSPIRR